MHEKVLDRRDINLRLHTGSLFLVPPLQKETPRRKVIYRGSLNWNLLSIELRSIESYT